MSAEKIDKQKATFITPQITEMSEKTLSGTVDINHLLARVRTEKQEKNKVNMIFFGMVVALIIISGILLSL